MNEKLKIFFNGFVTACILIISIIVTIIFRKNRRRIDTDVRKGIKQAGNACESAKRTSTELERATESAIGIEQDIESTNERLTESIESSRRILQELKKRHPEG